LRARLSDQPRCISIPGTAPLAMLPKASPTKGIQLYYPMSAKSNPRSCCRNFGVQKMKE
jgi:hypothetical protein